MSGMPRRSHPEWERVKDIAGAAWALDGNLRAALVVESCGGDSALRDEVLSLLQAMEAAVDRFETPPLVTGLADSIPAVTRPLPGGSLVGAWRVVKPIGEGGMGTVYLAERDTADFRQQAALKVIRAAASPDVVRRFHDERRILAVLDHPHIARLIDGGEDDTGAPYVVMEYVDGVPIDVYCAQHQLPLRERLVLFATVCRAVHYAHQRMVVHRDIKASNLMITTDGTPKLLDFGIAKMLSGGLFQATQTVYRFVTPDSASPEQIRGEPITWSTDVYALGVLLYRLLTGGGPYRLETGSETELTRAVCEQQPAPPSQRAVSTDSAPPVRIDRDLDRVVLKALRKEPDRRYGTAEQFAEDLIRHLEGRPVLAAPDSTVYRARKFIARHRIAVSAASGFAVAVALGVTAIVWQANIAREQRNRAQIQFNAVRTLANSLLGELHDTVAPLQGSLPARELLLRRAAEYLDALMPEIEQDRELRREVALGYERLAQVLGRDGFPNLGDRATSRASYEKAQTMLEGLGEDGLDMEASLALARTHVALSIGNIDPVVRNNHLSRAQTILERWTATQPSDPRVASSAIGLWFAVGNNHEAARDYVRASDTFKKAALVAEGVLAMDPASSQANRDLSLLYKKIATENELLGDVDTAIAYYGKAMSLDEERVTRDRARRLWRLDLSFSYNALGSLLAMKGRLDEAIERHRQALELRRDVVAEDPNDQFATTSLARGYGSYATTLGRAGRLDAATQAQLDRVHVLERWRRTHDGRINAWNDEVAARVDAFAALIKLYDGAPSRRAGRPGPACDMLSRAAQLPGEWVATKRQGVVASPESLATLLRRCR